MSSKVFFILIYRCKIQESDVDFNTCLWLSCYLLGYFFIIFIIISVLMILVVVVIIFFSKHVLMVFFSESGISFLRYWSFLVFV